MKRRWLLLVVALAIALFGGAGYLSWFGDPATSEGNRFEVAPAVASSASRSPALPAPVPAAQGGGAR